MDRLVYMRVVRGRVICTRGKYHGVWVICALLRSRVCFPLFFSLIISLGRYAVGAALLVVLWRASLATSRLSPLWPLTRVFGPMFLFSASILCIDRCALLLLASSPCKLTQFPSAVSLGGGQPVAATHGQWACWTCVREVARGSVSGYIRSFGFLLLLFSRGASHRTS